MYQYQKHFTLEEARGYLVHLKYDISALMNLKSKLDAIGFDIYTQKYRPGFNPDTLTEFPDEYMQLTEIIHSLHDKGMLVKGVEQGLIDFPALRMNGEEVFLCWQDGEDDIYFWHALDTGYRSRKPLAEF